MKDGWKSTDGISSFRVHIYLNLSSVFEGSEEESFQALALSSITYGPPPILFKFSRVVPT